MSELGEGEMGIGIGLAFLAAGEEPGVEVDFLPAVETAAVGSAGGLRVDAVDRALGRDGEGEAFVPAAEEGHGDYSTSRGYSQ